MNRPRPFRSAKKRHFLRRFSRFRGKSRNSYTHTQSALGQNERRINFAYTHCPIRAETKRRALNCNPNLHFPRANARCAARPPPPRIADALCASLMRRGINPFACKRAAHTPLLLIYPARKYANATGGAAIINAHTWQKRKTPPLLPNFKRAHKINAHEIKKNAINA